jgi:BirA family biotin operon repressor/biotin-[acetyl-CoA-carboxylase] ligase
MKSLYIEKVDSTNKWVKVHIKELHDKTLVYTFNQTAGRGRLNRTWCNIGADNIYATFVLKPSEKMAARYSSLTQYLCLVLAQTMEEYEVEPKIKWPNDIQINGKKISGILAEGVNVNSDGNFDGIALGVGVNLNASQSILENINQPATALNIETGKNIDKEEFLKKLSERFFLMYDEFIEEGFLLIKNEYIKRFAFLNKDISVSVFDKIIKGKAVGITDDGALKIVDNNKNEQILLIGDIL